MSRFNFFLESLKIIRNIHVLQCSLLGDWAFECQRNWRWLCLVWYRPLCFCRVNAPSIKQLNLYNKSSEVCIKTRSLPASLPFKGQVTKQTTVIWSAVFLLFRGIVLASGMNYSTWWRYTPIRVKVAFVSLDKLTGKDFIPSSETRKKHPREKI